MKTKKEIEKRRLKIFLILAGIFVLVSSVLFLIPFKYEASLFYDVKEPYTITESYLDKEPYKFQEVYIDYEPVEYDVLERSYRNYFWTSGCDVWINIQNIDDVGGYFSIDFDVTTSKGNYKTTSKRYFISGGSTQYFVVSFEGDYKKSDYDVNYPKKEVTKIKIVTKYKEVTKYRTVTKYKTIQEERQISKRDTLFNMIRGKTQYAFYE